MRRTPHRPLARSNGRSPARSEASSSGRGALRVLGPAGGLPLVLLVAAAAASAAPARDAVADDFAAVRDVLERRCLECHGGAHRESGLSFADASTFAQGGARGPVVDVDAPDASRLLKVVRYGNPDLAMPPSGVLPDGERAVLEAWVHAGASWPEGPAGRLADPAAHPLEDEAQAVGAWWAYDPLVRPEVPDVDDPAWSEHPVDAFLAARFAEAGVEPAPLASPATLLRRASFDLTGLPPTPDERRAFLDDVDARGFDAAWSALLDRLFASPHYGEAQARHWLDLVRYGETNGYERDARKTNVWRYRDWVVRAYDRDLPYDRFAQLQLAGDELVGPDATAAERADALLATGYHRLGVWDDEPADPEQAAADEVAGIVDTTAQVFLATTMGCARCHDHKADPVTQAEYFELTAHFAGVVGFGGGGFGQSRGGGATLDVADPPGPGVRTVAEREAERAALDERLAAEARALGLDAPAPGAEATVLVPDARAGGTTWRHRRGDVPDAWTAPAFDAADWEAGRGGFGTAGTPGARIGTVWDSRRIQLRTTFRLDAIPAALRLRLHHDEDVAVYLNGALVLRREGYVTDYLDVQLGADALAALVVGRNVLAVQCRNTGGGQYVDVGLDTRVDPEAEGGLLAALAQEVAARPEDPALADVRALLAEREALLAAPVSEPYPAQVVSEVGPEAPPQHVHLRGSVHAPGDEVRPGVPAAWTFGSAPDAAPHAVPPPAPGAASSGRRRAFAAWLFDGGRHLAARVEANRTWQFLFGRGLCRTAGDFGRLGERPTHPLLLDFLASELIEREWSRKGLQRFLMESRAYRTSSVPGEALLAADPRNDLFARFQPRRLTAEEFRDAALAVSGELNPTRFGPSVFPPLPAEVLATSSRPDAAWSTSSPEDAARRSLYVHTKRSLREPLLAALDQPDPDLPCPERFPTNVPTQALLTLNGDFTNARAAAFAADLSAAADAREARLRLAIERALGRAPEEGEVERAAGLLARLEERHDVPPERALELFLLGLLNRNEFLWLD